MTLIVHLLDDFLDTLETLPPELQAGFNELYRMEQELDELCKSLNRKRVIYLKAEEKGLEPTVQANFIRKIEKEDSKGIFSFAYFRSAGAVREEDTAWAETTWKTAGGIEAIGRWHGRLLHAHCATPFAFRSAYGD